MNKYWPLLFILTACEPTVQTRYITTELSRPQRPLLPKIKADELQCLKQDVYQRLYDRNRLVSDYAITLEAIIDSTKQKQHQSTTH